MNLLLFLFTELISSQPQLAEETTLQALFPRSNGIHFPEVEKISGDTAHAIPNFKELNGQKMLRERSIYLKRKHVIFAWLNGDDIEQLGPLFHQPLFAVFDTINKTWYTLQFPEISILGVTHKLTEVRARDHQIAQQQQDDESREEGIQRSFYHTYPGYRPHPGGPSGGR